MRLLTRAEEYVLLAVLKTGEEAYSLVQQNSGLSGIEAQILNAQFKELSTAPETRQGQGWITAAGDDQMDLRW